MANTKFSTTLIQAGKNTQEFARQLQKAEGLTGIPENAKTLTPTTPTWPLAQGVGWTLQKAGEGLQNLGFDESATDSEVTGSIVHAFSPATSDPILNSVIADEAGGFDSITGQNSEAEMDEEVGGPKASQILTATGAGITAVGSGVTIYALASTPATGPAGAGVALGGAVTTGIGAVTTLTGQTLGLFGLDVVEDDGPEGKFGANPQPLTPIDLNSAMVTDAYQHQNAPGADLIAGEPNQGIDPYQAQREQYEVLA